MKRFFLGLVFALMIISPFFASAHEAYVLSNRDWSYGVGHPGFKVLYGAFTPENIKLIIFITFGILIVFFINFLFRLTPPAKFIGRRIEKLAPFGPVLVRVTFAIALFFSAHTSHIWGPELPLSMVQYGSILKVVLYAASISIALGFMTEVMALISLGVFILSARAFGAYTLTYLNYLGEIIVLILFGSRRWSLDKIIFGPLRRFRDFRKYKTVILRLSYGLALAYAAVNIKLLHPMLTLEVVNKYHLNQFHWLFPSDPLLIALGAAFAELAIGILIIIGLEMRLTILISLFYITLSLLFFREAVWPHLLLYGISFNLFVEPETFTLDHLFETHFRRGFLRGLFTHGTQGRD